MKPPSILLICLFSMGFDVFADSLAVAENDPLSGLWAYQTIAHRGEVTLPNKGLFLFRDGRFFQQSLDEEELPDASGKMGQAHTGTYQIINDVVYFDVQLGVSVIPNRYPVVETRRNGKNHAKFVISDEVLTLSFNENSVQILRKLHDGDTETHLMDDGYLAFSGDKFILMSLENDDFIAGSGVFSKNEKGVSLHANSWIFVSGERVSYPDSADLHMDLEHGALGLSDGKIFHLQSDKK